MNIISKDKIRNTISEDLCAINDRFLEMSKCLDENVKDSLIYFRELATQFSQPTCNPLITKTPKILRKRGVQYIETIPETDIFQPGSTSASSVENVEEEKEAKEIACRRSKRAASQRAVDNIKRQNLLTLHTKLRRPTDDGNNDVFVKKRKLNETIVIQKEPNQRNSRETKENTNLKKALQDSTHGYKETVQDNMHDELITDDESSPEIKKTRKQIAKKEKRAVSVSSDDEVPNTPVKTYFKEPAVTQEAKTVYKSNALFSPYAKESVKKRVEAFEQAVTHSSKSVDVDAPTRITRTKTRAMAAAKAEDFKENKEQMPERINKLYSSDKSDMKQMQHLKTAPLGKMKILPPTSASRLPTPPNTQNFLNYPKVLTASRANISNTVDSFIQPPKAISKTNSVEKLEDKKRHEENVRKKREEALRLLTEEKIRKRQEKELRNKLAREAKEKQELEKRQKAKKEKQEKAILAQLMQEKQREEMGKKRQAQLLRAQEKEERRKLEEQQRLQRLQEQEEAEHLLVEQRHREQEAEKRREAEARAQQQVAAEALKRKNQMLAAQAKYKHANNKYQDVANYPIDSEPSSETDDETKPKHEIPYWAQAHVRKTQLAMQRHVSEEVLCKFFDTRNCTPDLTELFHGIDRRHLKRTSSAIWKTPPRFSMMEAE